MDAVRRIAALLPSLSFALSLLWASGVPHASATALKESGTPSIRQCTKIPRELLARSFEFNNAATDDFPIELSVQAFRPDGHTNEDVGADQSLQVGTQLQRAPEGGRIGLRLLRPAAILTSDDWLNSYLYGVGLLAEATRSETAARVELVSLQVRAKTSDYILVDAILPDNPSIMRNADWTIIPVLCGGRANKLLGYGSFRLTLASVAQSKIVALALIVVFWALLSYVAWQLNKLKLDALWKNDGNRWRSKHPDSNMARIAWKATKAMNPVFIAQDSLGYGSLARFQILIFSTAVGFVLLYIFMHSAVISSLSDTILLLLGVTVGGGTIARYKGDWQGIKPATRRWLVGSGILRTRQDEPLWADVLETQGELDVAKVQALLFTGVITIAILASGVAGLGTFNLPYQIVYLAALSQGTYVAGKFLPAETRTKVEEDISSLRSSASALAAMPNDRQLREEYERTRVTARETLKDTYLIRFDPDLFDKLTDPPPVAETALTRDDDKPRRTRPTPPAPAR